MNFELIKAEIRKRLEQFITQGGDGGEQIPTQFPNSPFKPPSEAPWIGVAVLPASAPLIELGASKRYRNQGAAIVSIRTPLGKGEGASDTIVGRVSRALRDQTFNGVVFRQPFVTFQGGVGAHWLVNLTCPYYADEFSPQPT